MPPARSDRRLTYADFQLFPDDGRRHEIIDGRHYVIPSPSTRHWRLVARVHTAFLDHLREHPDSGAVFLAPFDVVFTPFDIVKPDLLFVTADQRDIATDAHVRGAPAIVIEVVSQSTRRVDETIKYALFERSGVREYWLVDPALDVVKVYRRSSSASFSDAIELTPERGDHVTTPLLPGFTASLVAVFC